MTLLILLPASAPALAQEWHFKVSADGRPIGTHDFKVTGDADGRSVETTATFKATMLRVPFYHYEHHDKESWKSGCLQQIDADTNDNGKRSLVHGHSEPQGFHLDSTETVFTGCLQTFAYWDKSFLQQPRLLDSQTGEITSISTARLGTERIPVVGQTVEAEHYSLKTPRFSIDLWYSLSGEWLALESLTENGHRLRYEKQ